MSQRQSSSGGRRPPSAAASASSASPVSRLKGTTSSIDIPPAVQQQFDAFDGLITTMLDAASKAIKDGHRRRAELLGQGLELGQSALSGARVEQGKQGERVGHGARLSQWSDGRTDPGSHLAGCSTRNGLLRPAAAHFVVTVSAPLLFAYLVAFMRNQRGCLCP